MGVVREKRETEGEIQREGAERERESKGWRERRERNKERE